MTDLRKTILALRRRERAEPWIVRAGGYCLDRYIQRLKRQVRRELRRQAGPTERQQRITELRSRDPGIRRWREEERRRWNERLRKTVQATASWESQFYGSLLQDYGMFERYRPNP